MEKIVCDAEVGREHFSGHDYIYQDASPGENWAENYRWNQLTHKYLYLNALTYYSYYHISTPKKYDNIEQENTFL